VDISTRLQVVGAVDFDPDGDGHEEPDLVRFAYDDNLATAWHTLSYRQADLAPKSGVGVVFDLGRIETVGAVRLNLLGAGTSLQVRTARTPGATLSHFTKFGSATGLGDLVALRKAEPVQARYVLVWLTRLPADGSTYRGGIAEVEVARS
jgi:putative peptidoglycan lipid II flippase